jgi:acyl-CoA reductase-like NAD-dependent aldehyde dehydrogenase
VPEPTGVVGVVAPDEPPLLGLVSRLAPAIVGGTTAVVLSGERAPLVAVSLGEVLATSDVPGGVVNLLTGHKAELLSWLAGHMDVNALDLTGCPPEMAAETEATASENVKRVHRAAAVDAFDPRAQSPYEITALLELKTVWHPIGA